MQSIKDITEKLRERDYKLTPQRRIILEAFLDHADGHLSAEDVYYIVKERDPEIGLATVYRTIDLLAEMDVLQRINFGDGRSRYEIAQDDVHHHHHLICVKCGSVYEFDDDLLETLEAMISRKTNFKIIDHQLKVYGICRRCQQQAADSLPST